VTVRGRTMRAAEALRPAGDRMVRRALGLWQRATHAWRDRGLSVASQHPVIRDLAALERAEDRGTPRHTVARLRVALRGNAYETALALAREVQLDLVEPPKVRVAALILLLETYLAHGERDRATALARAHVGELSRSLHGAGLLEVLELGPTPLVLPDGTPSPLAIRRAIDHGELDAAATEALLDAHPRALLRHPDRHLLVESERGLNRFLRSYGLPGARLVERPGLARFAFDPAPPVTGGPLVSVLVAAHDAADTIESTIDSLLHQSYQNLEILVGDDASTDGTVDRIRRDPRVRLFRSQRNQGAYHLRNALLAHARGELVTFHDADDLALPSRIALQVERMRTAVASYTCFVRVTPSGRVVFFRDQAAVRLCMVTLMTTPARLRALGGFRGAAFGADLEVHQRLLHEHGAAKIDVVRAPLVFARWDGASATRRAGAEAHEDGYRSPARRAYAELVFRRMRDGDVAVPDTVIDDALRASGNLRDPAPITPVE
jgi:hypothetical protein